MNKFYLSVLVCALNFGLTYSQTISDIIDEVNLDSLTVTVNEFSGEVPTVVNGNTVTLLNRLFNNNDLAAEYLFERLDGLDNITVENQLIDDEPGRTNIIATQKGITNPDNVYIICAHYDAIANYCADDNASGVAAVLEVARVLSGQCLDNTIIYAFWDEEEIGLVGSEFYAEQAKNNGDTILGVYNLDMIGYDADNDQSFDMDVKLNDAGSQGMSDDVLEVLNAYPFKLNANVIIPGTEHSDHSSFWNRGFPAVLIGEAWSEDDQNPKYHTSEDRIDLFNMQFFHELTKLSAGYMATKAGLAGVDNTVTISENSLVAAQDNANYQWYSCTTDTAIPGATSQQFTPTENGEYRVEVASGDCIEFSDCITFSTLGLAEYSETELRLFPNPVKSQLTIERTIGGHADFRLYNVAGKLLFTISAKDKTTEIDLNHLPKGVYFLDVEDEKKQGVYKVVKE